MAKSDTIEVEGKVIEVLPGGKFRVELENNIYGYRFDSYDIRIGNNLIKLYSTDREKDNYSFIREMILKSLRDDEINLDVVKRIENKK